MLDRFALSGRVVGAVGGESCTMKNGGPSNVNVELLSSTGDLISSVSTSSEGSYIFKNIVPGMYVIMFAEGVSLLNSSPNVLTCIC